MAQELIKTLDVLLFSSGKYNWAVDVYWVKFVKWGVSKEKLKVLNQKKIKNILGVIPRFGLEVDQNAFPAIPLVGSNDSFDYQSFYGDAIFLEYGEKKFAILADEITGTETLTISKQIYLPPVHLKQVFKGKNIWAVASIRNSLVYLFEPVSGV